MALPRKRRRRAPRGWSEGLDDLHDYMQAQPRRRQGAAARIGAVADDGPIRIADDWPERVPITDAELRIIEGHLRKELDALFGPLP